MTKEEKQIVKGMNKLIFDLATRQSLFFRVISSHIPDWPKRITERSFTAEEEALCQENDAIRTSIDEMIDAGRLAEIPLLLRSVDEGSGIVQ